MPNNASDIILSPARLFYAPVGEALPDETTVEYGAAWGGNWTELGYTNAPITLSYSYDEYEVEVEQVTLPLRRTKTGEDVMIETTLVEITADNLQLAMGGAVTTTAAGAAQRGFEELRAGGETALDTYAWGFEGRYEDATGTAFPVRLFLWKATATLNGDLAFAKAQETGIPIQVKALADTSQPAGQQLLVFQKVTAEATA